MMSEQALGYIKSLTNFIGFHYFLCLCLINFCFTKLNKPDLKKENQQILQSLGLCPESLGRLGLIIIIKNKTE